MYNIYIYIFIGGYMSNNIKMKYLLKLMFYELYT